MLIAQWSTYCCLEHRQTYRREHSRSRSGQVDRPSYLLGSKKQRLPLDTDVLGEVRSDRRENFLEKRRGNCGRCWSYKQQAKPGVCLKIRRSRPKTRYTKKETTCVLNPDRAESNMQVVPSAFSFQKRSRICCKLLGTSKQSNVPYCCTMICSRSPRHDFGAEI